MYSPFCVNKVGWVKTGSKSPENHKCRKCESARVFQDQLSQLQRAECRELTEVQVRMHTVAVLTGGTAACKRQRPRPVEMF
jgi:hypothetical protein